MAFSRGMTTTSTSGTLPPTSDLTLVVGATGKTGSRVAALLRAAGRAVRAGSRNAEPPFDWEDRSTWEAALDGVSAAYVAYVPDLAVPAAGDTVEAFAKTAAAAGVQRLVLLSGRGEPEAQEAEARVQACGVDVTVVRAGWFAQNFSEAFLADDVRSGAIALPVDPSVREPYIDADDIAAVAVAALTEPGHGGRVHEVTGPRALTLGEVAAELSAATGREVVFVPVPAADYAAGLAAAGLADEMVRLYLYLLTEVLDGRNAATTDAVQSVLGRPARDFADYARRAAATGVWR